MAKDVIADLEARISTNLSEFKKQMDSQADSVKSSTGKMNTYLGSAKKGFADVSTGIGSFLKGAGQIAGVATAASVGLGYVVNKNLDVADSIGKAADKIGIGTENLQLYRKAGELAGISTGTLDKSIGTFAKRVGELNSETGALYGYLNKANPELVTMLKNADSNGQAFQIFMEAIAGTTNHADKLALSAAGFSKGPGIEMVNLVKDGNDAFVDMVKELKGLGIAIDDDLIRGAEAANDSLEILKTVIGVEITNALLGFAPVITRVTGEMTGWVKANQAFIDSKVDKFISDLSQYAEDFDGEAFAKKLKIVADGAEIVADGIDLVVDAVDGWSMIMDIMRGDYDKLVVKMQTGSSDIEKAIQLVKIDLDDAREALELLTNRDHVFGVTISEKEYADARKKISDLETTLADLEAKETKAKIDVEADEAEKKALEVTQKLDNLNSKKTTVTISANTADAEVSIVTIEGQLTKISDGTTEATVIAEITDAEGKIHTIETRLDTISTDATTVTLVVENTDADTKLTDIENRLSDLTSENQSVTVDIDTDQGVQDVLNLKAEIEKGNVILPVDANLEAAEKGVERLIYTVEGQSYYMDVKAETEDATDTVTKFTNEINGMKAEILIGGDTDPALKRLKEIEAIIEAEEARVQLGADPTMGENELAALKKEVVETEASITVLANADPAENKVSVLKDSVDATVATMNVDANVDSAIEELDRLGKKAEETMKKMQNIGHSTGMTPGQWAEVEKYTNYNLNGQPTNLADAVEQAKANPDWDSLAVGTGMAGLPEDGPIYAHKGEIVLTPQESDVFRGVANGMDPMTFLNGLMPLKMGGPGPSTVTNHSNRQSDTNYNINVNQQVIGDRPAMSAREMASELSFRINQQKSRFGEL